MWKTDRTVWNIHLLASSLSTAFSVLVSIFQLHSRLLAGVIFDDQPTRVCKNDSYAISFYFFLQPLISLSQNEQILDRNCTKDSDSASSKVGLVKGPTTLVIHSAFSTLSASQSPAPSAPVLQSHSCCLSALLGQGIPIKDGVSIPQSNVGAVKQGLSLSSFFQLLLYLFSLQMYRFSGDFWINRWRDRKSVV